MKIKNFYTANTAEPGDVFLVTIKAMIMYDGTYRLYRCPFNYDDDIPDGDRLFNDSSIVGETILPILLASNGPDRG